MTEADFARIREIVKEEIDATYELNPDGRTYPASLPVLQHKPLAVPRRQSVAGILRAIETAVGATEEEL